MYRIPLGPTHMQGKSNVKPKYRKRTSTVTIDRVYNHICPGVIRKRFVNKSSVVK